jgi:hypothetical protein
MIGNRAAKKNKPQSTEDTEKKMEFPAVISRSTLRAAILYELQPE